MPTSLQWRLGIATKLRAIFYFAQNKNTHHPRALIEKYLTIIPTLTTHLHLMPRSRMVELHFHSPIYLFDKGKVVPVLN
jgi:hypothetical protein